MTTTTTIGNRLDIYGKTPTRAPGEPATDPDLNIETFAADLTRTILNIEPFRLEDLPTREAMTPIQYIRLEEHLRALDLRIAGHKWYLKNRLRDVARHYGMAGIGEVKTK